MKDASNSSTAPQASTEAASHWLMRLQDDTVTDADIAEWLKWCADDPQNLAAFDEMQRLYDRLRALEAKDRDVFLHLTHEPPRAARSRITEFIGRIVTRWRRSLVALSVAGLSGLAIAAWLLLRPTSIDAHDYKAPRGDQEALILADRSQITLGGESEVASHFTAQVRLVELRKGEAFFEIQHDSARPFVVTANGVTVTAVGTKFNVRRTETRTVVVVAEGAVDVSTNDPVVSSQSPQNFVPDRSPSSPVRVRAGQQAVREAAQRGLIVSDTDPAAATAWRQGRLAYIMEPLSSVIEDVNRYASRRILVADPRVSEMTFTGTIFREHIDDWAMTLRSAFPVNAAVNSDGTITLSMRSDSH
jgi:transmembrane sensor